MKTLKSYKEEFNINEHFNVYKCDHCETEMIGRMEEDFEVELFEPREVEIECLDTKTFKQFKKKIIESSDFYKDTIVFKCPHCGHIHRISRDEFYRKQRNVNICGDKSMIFRLNEKEAQNANDFMKEHKNCCKEKLGKPFFSSTGGQFSYTITPTGLGLGISIKCNACGEQKDITNSEDW